MLIALIGVSLLALVMILLWSETSDNLKATSKRWQDNHAAQKVKIERLLDMRDQWCTEATVNRDMNRRLTEQNAELWTRVKDRYEVRFVAVQPELRVLHIDRAQEFSPNSMYHDPSRITLRFEARTAAVQMVVDKNFVQAISLPQAVEHLADEIADRYHQLARETVKQSLIAMAGAR